MKLYANYNFQGNQIQFAAIHPLSSAPSNPFTAQLYYDTNADQLLVRTVAGAWGLKATDSALFNGQNAAYYLNRGNHTGTITTGVISDFASAVTSYRLDQFAAPTVSVNFNSQRATGAADPINPQDLTTMGWVQNQLSNAAAGIDSKPSVRALATTNITLSGLQTIDGVALQANDRVLVRGQSNNVLNGTYVAVSGAWSRALDADQTGELTPGAFWYVEEGSQYAKTQWRIENTGTITVNTTGITINQFGAAQMYTNGNGLSLSGGVFAVVANTGILSTVNGVAVDTTVVTRKSVYTIGNGSATTIAVTHNLGTKAVSVSTRLVSTDESVIVDWTATDVNTVTFYFNTAPASSSLTGVIIG